MVRLTVIAPVGAVKTYEEPQLEITGAAELLTVMPGGRLSVMDTLLRLVSAGATTSMRKRELPPAVMVVGVKDLLLLTGKGSVEEEMVEEAAVMFA